MATEKQVTFIAKLVTERSNRLSEADYEHWSNAGYVRAMSIGEASKLIDQLLNTKRVATATPKTDCGHYWKNLKSSCPVCNGGPHYHYSDGSCDMEPCYRHGGPA